MSDPWNVFNRNAQDSNPIGKEMEKFVFENCQWVILLRRDTRFKCPTHWREEQGSTISFDQYDDMCLGLGVKTTVNVIPARINTKESKRSLREADNRVQPGTIQYSLPICYVPRTVKANTQDYILTVGWEDRLQDMTTHTSRKPLKIQNVYSIKASNSFYERELGWQELGLELTNFKLIWAKNILAYLVKNDIILKDTTWRTY